jgi:hypothetical protein
MILLALNELNLDLIKGYASQGKLSNFKKLLENGVSETTSENSYELLEPWIQWTSIHTGKTFNEHKVFRLGDIAERQDLFQIFEDLENNGLSVGAISPFNADNRLTKSKFFLPDPWTKTTTSGSTILKRLSRTVSCFVNSNASGRIRLIDLIWLIFGFLMYVRVKRWYKFILLILKNRMPGVKAAILDCNPAEKA